MISARTYGYGPGNGGELNRIALATACSAAALIGDRTVEVPHGGRVASKRGAGYCVQLTAGFELVTESGLPATIYQYGDHGGVPHQLFQVIAGSNYVIGRGGGLTLDGSLAIPKPVNDQNHLFNVVATGGPVTGVTFDRVRFQHSGGGGLNTGDAFRCVGGSPEKMVTGVSFDTCSFFHNGRADITPIYHTDGLSANDCTFDEVSDRAIGIELSTGTLKNLKFKTCKFNSNRSPGVPIVSLAGFNRESYVDGAEFDDCFFGGGGFFSGYAKNVTLRKCKIKPEKVASGIGSCTLVGMNDNFLFEETEIDHYREQGNIPCVLAYNNAGTGPRGVRFNKVDFLQEANTHCLSLTHSDEIEINDGSIKYDGTTDNGFYAVYARPLAINLTKLSMTGTIVSRLGAARLAACAGFTVDNGFTIGGVNLRPRMVSGCVTGIYTPGTQASYVDEPVFMTDMEPGTIPVGQSGVNAPVVCVGGTRGKRNIRYLSGWPAPEGVVMGVIGCVYERKETNQKYYKATGTYENPSLTGWLLM